MNDDLQFDRAEFGPQEAPASLACQVCHTPILESYFEAAGSVVCPACREGIRGALEGGSGPIRFVSACVLGSVAGVIGAVCYFAVVQLSGYHLGLLAIFVGWLVGTGVRRGSRHRGGWLYQILAVLLTYLSICGFFFPLVYTGIAKPASVQADPEARDVGEGGSPAPGSSLEPGAPGSRDAPEAPGTAPGDTPPSRWIGLVVAILFAGVLSLAAPIMAGTQSPMLLLIFGFGLVQAWSLNARVNLEFTGPFQVGAAAPEGAGA